MLLSETGRMGKGAEKGMRILPHLSQKALNHQENSNFSADFKNLHLRVYVAVGQKLLILSFFKDHKCFELSGTLEII